MSRSIIGWLAPWAAVAGLLACVVCPLTILCGAPEAPPTVEPVEPSMHEFMEYVFEPGYKRLKAGLAAEPPDRAAWRNIKADALVLAEGANLLLLRMPEEGSADDWRKLSAAVRADGAKLYQAARKADYPATRAAYEILLKRCNACHEDFADGEHILAP